MTVTAMSPLALHQRHHHHQRCPPPATPRRHHSVVVARGFSGSGAPGSGQLIVELATNGDTQGLQKLLEVRHTYVCCSFAHSSEGGFTEHEAEVLEVTRECDV